MIVFFKVLIVLLIGNINCEVHGRRSHKQTNLVNGPDGLELYIEIGINGTEGQPARISHNGSYEMSIGQALNLTCRQKGAKFIKWTDDSSVGTGPRDGKALSLVITPDEDDINHKFACRANFYGDEHTRTVKLVVEDERYITPGPGNVVFLKIGEFWPSEQCDSVIIYDQKPPRYIKPLNGYNIKIPFNETLDRVILYCIKYNKVGERLKYVERLKSRFTLYLDRGEEENARRKKELENSEVTSKDSQSNAAAIVGGVLGAVIFVLLALLLGIGYKTMRRRTPDDSATNVVYAEIEERVTAPPPPPRNPIPYAQIIGTLVPKQAAQTDNPTTIQSQEKDDPYSTMTSVANDRGTQMLNER